MRATSRTTSTRIVILATAVVALVAPLVTLTALGSATVTRSWTLSGVTFTDGGVMAGTFDLGSDGAMSNVAITTSGGNTGAFGNNTSYGPAGFNQGDGTWIVFISGGFTRYIRLALPDVSQATVGQSYPLGLGLDRSQECPANCGTARLITAGSIVAGTATGGADTTPPIVTGSVSPSAPDGDNGWYVGSPQVSFSVSDPDGPITGSSPDCAPTTVSADTAGTTLTCSATSAGGAASDAVTVQRDATPPDVSGSDVTDTTWRNTPLSVDFTATDLTSGLADTGDASFTLTASADSADAGTPTVVTKTVSDVAGNTTTRSVSALIDTIPPSVSLAHSATSVVAGSPSATETLTATDGGSGLDGAPACTADGSPATLTPATSQTWTFDVTGDGPHHLSCSASDLAGGSSDATDDVTLSVPPVTPPSSTPPTTSSPTPSASPTASATPSSTPTARPTGRPSPTALPTVVPTATSLPTAEPTSVPLPTVPALPSEVPSVVPTVAPQPSGSPSASAHASPSPSPSASTSSSPTAVTPSTAPSDPLGAPTGPVLDPSSGSRPEPDPGTVEAFLNGSPTNARITVNGNTVDVTSGPLHLQLEAMGPDGTVHAPSGSGSLLLDLGGDVHVHGTGFTPGAGVAFWEFSTPARLGGMTAGSSGTFDATVHTPRAVGGGHHTLQINGLSTDGSRSISLGLLVDPTGLPVWQALDHVKDVTSAQVAFFAIAGLAAVGSASAIGSVAVPAPAGPRDAGGEKGGAHEDGRAEDGESEEGSESEEGEGGEEGESEQDILEALKGSEGEEEGEAHQLAIVGFLDRHLQRLHAWTDRHAPGDHSRTWRTPGHTLTDRLSLVGPSRVSTKSPLTAKLLVDGMHLRAAFGSAWIFGVLAGIATGVVAALHVDAVAAPSLAAVAVAVAVGTIDAFAGFIAAGVFVATCLAAGSLAGVNEWRGALGVASLFFIVPLMTGEARPLRREPAKTTAEAWHRLGDFLVLPPLGAWLVWRLVKALPALYGHVVPLSSHAGTLGLVAGGALLARLAVEEIATWFYPNRLRAVAPHEIAEPSPWRKALGILVKGGLFVFVAAPFVGLGWGLAIGGVLFLLPAVLALAPARRLPHSRVLGRVLPSGLVKITALMVVGYYLSQVVEGHLSNQSDVITLGFIILSIPPCLLGMLALFGEDGHPPVASWRQRWAGTVATCVCCYAVVTLSLLK